MSEMRISTQKDLLPKYETKSEAKTTWCKSNSSHLRLVTSEKQESSNKIPPEIQTLVEELVEKVDEIKRVIAVATSFPDIHWIDFKIELKADIELSDETWDKIQDMVIDCEWKLIDDSSEEWYFRPQIVDKFYPVGDAKVADSDQKQYIKVNKIKMWSIDSQFS